MRLFITIGVHMLIYFACDFTSDLSEGRVWPEAAVVPISLMDFRPLSMRCISSWDKAAHFATGERFMRPIEPWVCFPTVVSRLVSGYKLRIVCYSRRQQLYIASIRQLQTGALSGLRLPFQPYRAVFAERIHKRDRAPMSCCQLTTMYRSTCCDAHSCSVPSLPRPRDQCALGTHQGRVRTVLP